MKKYRIITNGEKFRIQKRVGWWTWMDMGENIVSSGEMLCGVKWNPIEYSILEEAHKDIESYTKREILEKWKVVK